MKIDHHIATLAPGASHAEPSAHPAYRSDIDGLRAIAVLAVVVFHAFPALVPGGFIGVDIFFVISGFLISTILANALANGSFSFAGFYARRIKRIFPALLLVMAATLAFAWFALFPDELAQLGRHVAGGAGFLSNVVLWQEVGYFDRAADTKPLLHLWSLAIEEQFYIVWPVLLLLAWKRGASLLATAAVLAVLSFAINAGAIHAFPSATFYSPASRAWELLAGAMLACAWLRPAPLLARSAALLRPNAWSALGALLLALGFALITAKHRFPGWYALLPVAGAVMLIGAGPHAWFNRVVLSNRLMVWIGLISYPLYLWHWPLLSYAHIIESGTPAPQLRAALVALAALLAWLTYRLVERPLRLGHGRYKVAALAALMVLIAASGAWIARKGGLPQRAAVVENARHQKSLVLVEDVQNAAACKQRYRFDSIHEYCLMAHVDREPTVVLIGDSHAYHVVAGLTRYYTSVGENLLMLGTRHPYWGLPAGDDAYQKATQPMLELALGMPSVKTIVISTHARLGTGTPEARAMLVAARDTIRRYTEAGKSVILMEDVPVLSFDPRACIKRAGMVSSGTRTVCALPRAEVEAQSPQNMELLAGLLREFPAASLFRTTDLLCDDKLCWAMKEGNLLYRDNNHLSYEGDLYIGSRFAEWHARRPSAKAGQ